GGEFDAKPPAPLTPLGPCLRIEISAGELSRLPPPLVGERWGGGRSYGGKGVRQWGPHPQPLPGRLRACPLPADPKVTKPRQAGVWLAGEHTECAAITLLQGQRTCSSASPRAPPPPAQAQRPRRYRRAGGAARAQAAPYSAISAAWRVRPPRSPPRDR